MHINLASCSCKRYQLIHHLFLSKKWWCDWRWWIQDYDLRVIVILGTKIHVTVDCNSLPISIVISPANVHDGMKLIEVMENIYDHLYDGSVKQIMLVYADKGTILIPLESIWKTGTLQITFLIGITKQSVMKLLFQSITTKLAT